MTLEQIKENQIKDKLLSLCRKYVKDQSISCAETIYQCDWIIESAYDFIKEVCDIVGYDKEEDEDDENNFD